MQACCRTLFAPSHRELPVNRLNPGTIPRKLPLWVQRRWYETPQACAGCVTGSLNAGIPRGTDITIAGIECYLSKPSTPNGNAVILATDIFGHRLINARLIADAFADNGYLAVVPNYFQSDPMNVKMLELSESLPQQSILGKIGVYAQLAGQVLGMAIWFPRHPVAHAVEVVTEWRQLSMLTTASTRSDCRGSGKVCVLVAAKPGSVDAVCAAHPSIVKVPDDIQAMKVPALFLCAETDAQFPEQKRTAAMQVSQQTAPGRDTFILYQGTTHGFAVRGNKADPAVNAARDDALQQGVQFFNRTLCWITAAGEQKDESLGVLLMSASAVR